MCGLVAIIAKEKSGFYQADKTIFYQMLLANMFRGMDSTGIFAVNRHGNLKWIKDASPSPFFINKKDASTFMDKFTTDFRIVVGHNRKATLGSIVSENAHPFAEGNICLVHNGTLSNHKKLANTTVDSHAICHHINESGYKSMFKTIDGAYALIWYNVEEKNLYFARNAERPLYMVETATKIYLASEDKMLDWILDRNNIAKYEIQVVPTDKVFKFNLETNKLECETKPKKGLASNQGGPNWMQRGQAHNSHKKDWSQAQTSGNLHLIHSSQSASQHLVASIDTYFAGEKLLVKPVDYNITEHATKIIFETMDDFKTPCCRFFPHTTYSQKVIDRFMNASSIRATIMNITSKKGDLTIWLGDVEDPEDMVTVRGGKTFRLADIADAGNCCYMCGSVFNSKTEIEDAKIEADSSGGIMYVTCGSCADQIDHMHNYRSSHDTLYNC